MGSLGSNFHDESGELTESGRRVRIQDKRWQRFGRSRMDGKDRRFFQVMSCWFGQSLNRPVHPESIHALACFDTRSVRQVSFFFLRWISCSTTWTNPVLPIPLASSIYNKQLVILYARRVNSLVLVCSLSSHRHSYIDLIRGFSSRFIDSK